jgi:hypothetical protein
MRLEEKELDEPLGPSIVKTRNCSGPYRENRDRINRARQETLVTRSGRRVETQLKYCLALNREDGTCANFGRDYTGAIKKCRYAKRYNPVMASP